MIAIVEERMDDVRRLCRRYKVRRLELFGSAASGDFKPEHSDIDFIVEFKPAGLVLSVYVDTYFGLLEGLEQLFERRVDLVERPAINNPYFLQSVERTRTTGDSA